MNLSDHRPLHFGFTNCAHLAQSPEIAEQQPQRFVAARGRTHQSGYGVDHARQDRIARGTERIRRRPSERRVLMLGSVADISTASPGSRVASWPRRGKHAHPVYGDREDQVVGGPGGNFARSTIMGVGPVTVGGAQTRELPQCDVRAARLIIDRLDIEIASVRS
jgi:hypothetical protein